MYKSPKIRPKIVRPITRNYKPSYFQMHVYDQELQRLDAERKELSKKVNLIEERVEVILEEISKLERALKTRTGSKY